MRSVLFVCSGNYYRSRFAEIVFNWSAGRQKLDWRAESRGFRISPNNIGPLSRHAVEGLQARAIPIPDPDRFPMVVEVRDFETFDLVVAVKEAEHRRKMLEHFPAWVDRIEYWHIDDIDCAAPDVALVQLEGELQGLIERLRKS